MKVGQYQIYSLPPSDVDYILKMECSEYIEDLSVTAETEGLTGAAANPLKDSSVGLLIPAVTPYIYGLETIMGIKLSSKTQKKTGMLRLELQVIDAAGEVLSSTSWPATFAVHVAEDGGNLSTTTSRTVVTSFPQDAVIAAVQAAVKSLRF